jgi:hypothetical protein
MRAAAQAAARRPLRDYAVIEWQPRRWFRIYLASMAYLLRFVATMIRVAVPLGFNAVFYALQTSVKLVVLVKRPAAVHFGASPWNLRLDQLPHESSPSRLLQRYRGPAYKHTILESRPIPGQFCFRFVQLASCQLARFTFSLRLPQPSTLNSQPSTLNPGSLTLNPLPLIPNP